MDGWFNHGRPHHTGRYGIVLYYPEDYIDDYYTARSEGETPDEKPGTGGAGIGGRPHPELYTTGALFRKKAPDILGTGDLYLLPCTRTVCMRPVHRAGPCRPTPVWFNGAADHAASYESKGADPDWNWATAALSSRNLAANGERPSGQGDGV